MSAPDTNVKKQEDRHKPALLGIKGAMIFGAIMVFLIVAFAFLRGEDSLTDPGAGGEGVIDADPDVEIDPYAPGTNVSN
jgi:hypothetical protein